MTAVFICCPTISESDGGSMAVEDESITFIFWHVSNYAE